MQATRLDPGQFPTAHEMNTGEGPLMAKRLERWLSDSKRNKPPIVGAYVMPQFQDHFKHADSGAYKDSPAKLEREFADEVGDLIPEDYLARVEDLFLHVHYVCQAAFFGPGKALHRHGSGKLVSTTPVLMAEVQAQMQPTYVESLGGPRVVTLCQVAVRQCGETFGFCRLLLHELARNCLFFGATLRVRTALAATKAIMRRAFGSALQTHGGDLYVKAEDLEDAAAQLGVQHLLLLERGGKRSREAEALRRLFGEQLRHTVFADDAAFLAFLRSQKEGLEHPAEETLQYCLGHQAQLLLRRNTKGWVVHPLKNDEEVNWTLMQTVKAYVERLRGEGTLLLDLTTQALVEHFRTYLEREKRIAGSAFTEGQIEDTFARLMPTSGPSDHPLWQSVLTYVCRETKLRLWRVGAGANPMCLGDIDVLVRTFWESPEVLRQLTDAQEHGSAELLALFREFADSKGFPGQHMFTDEALLRRFRRRNRLLSAREGADGTMVYALRPGLAIGPPPP